MSTSELGRMLVIASFNAGKVAEFRSLFAPLGWSVTSLADMPDAPRIVESGHTFMENACIKASTTAHYYGLPALADDSGLCVEVLDDRPGVYSARYAGRNADDAANNHKLMLELREKGLEHLQPADPRRRARFVCALVLVMPHGAEVRAQGECPGYILSEPRGENGFGYDPLFYVPAYDKTMAELTADEKNRISHRAQALDKMRAVLQA